MSIIKLIEAIKVAKHRELNTPLQRAPNYIPIFNDNLKFISHAWDMKGNQIRKHLHRLIATWIEMGITHPRPIMKSPAEYKVDIFELRHYRRLLHHDTVIYTTMRRRRYIVIQMNTVRNSWKYMDRINFYFSKRFLSFASIAIKPNVPIQHNLVNSYPPTGARSGYRPSNYRKMWSS